jgi:hypothetical protein
LKWLALNIRFYGWFCVGRWALYKGYQIIDDSQVHVFQCGRDREGGCILNYFLFKNILKQYLLFLKIKLKF